jgi:tungstate transport system substrate-binding protein
MPLNDALMTRRRFIELGTTILSAEAGVLAGMSIPAVAGAMAPLTSGRVRVASVATDVEGGLLPALLDTFRLESGMDVTLQFDNAPYSAARQGLVDLVISHFGHRDTEGFVLQGLGMWPRTVFANQLGLFGPAVDPAGIRGLTSLVQAFGRIAQSQAPYLLNGTPGIRYLTEFLWHAAGKPPKGNWLIETGGSKQNAIALAAEKEAYVLWGLTPFQRERMVHSYRLEPLLTADPLLQRIMVSVVVNAGHLPGTNTAGAARLQDYLLSPAVQARMLEVHYPGIQQAVWAPAGRHNAASRLSSLI